MNFFRKTLATFLIMLMTLCMSSIAFAEGEKGTITINNATSGVTYSVYKVFDVEYNAEKTAYAYTIKNTSKWYDTVSNYKAGFKLTASAADSDVFVVEMLSGFDAVTFTGMLAAVATKPAADAFEIAGSTTVEFENLALGYYYVTSSVGSLCNLTTTNPNATINDKNEFVFEKTADDVSVELGQVINFKVTGIVRDTTGLKTYIYTYTDTMSEGLTFNENVTVKVGDVVLENTYYTVTYQDNGFVLEIDQIKLNETKANIGKQILITYTATVNEKAVTKIETNKVTLKYTNAPGGGVKETTQQTTHYSAKIVIDKVDSSEAHEKLAGAEFVLQNATPENANNGKYYKLSNNTVSWVATIAEATKVTTDEAGAASFPGLEDGTYKLHETKAPAGYNLLTEDKEIVINGADLKEVSLTQNVQVVNSTGSILPETGGIGTTILYVIGGLLMTGAVVLLITKKRMCKDN